MSSHFDNVQLGRGEHDAGLAKHAGSEKTVEDIDYSVSPAARRSADRVTLRLVKNSSTIALKGKRLLRYKAGTNRTEVDGYENRTASEGNTTPVSDEFLPAAGVPVGSYFWAVVEGPAIHLTSVDADAGNLIPEETVLVAETIAASTDDDGGRVVPQDGTGSGVTLTRQLNGAVGRALSAKTTANSDDDILVYVSNRWK